MKRTLKQVGNLITNILKTYSICIIRLCLILSLTLIGVTMIRTVESTLTGNYLTAIVSTVLTLLFIKINKEIQ